MDKWCDDHYVRMISRPQAVFVLSLLFGASSNAHLKITISIRRRITHLTWSSSIFNSMLFATELNFFKYLLPTVPLSCFFLSLSLSPYQIHCCRGYIVIKKTVALELLFMMFFNSYVNLLEMCQFKVLSMK